MKKHTLLIVLVALALLFAGCQDETVLPKATRSPDVEPTASYDWMAGESPVPNKRIGMDNKADRCAVSPTGVYYLYQIMFVIDQTPPSPMILYADHGSDVLIKLCGRPDCTHDTKDCNAYVENGSRLEYYNGYLYIVSEGYTTTDEKRCVLLRMNPDGTERIQIFDFTAFAKENGCAYAAISQIIDGYCLFSTFNWKDTDEGGRTGDQQQSYLYKLDGSMEPKAIDVPGWILHNCGDVTLTYLPQSENGGQYGSYWDWDAETNTLNFLSDHPGEPGWFGETEAYYFKDGAVRRLTYATGEEEIVIQTDLKGDYFAYCFPDCIMIVSNTMRDLSDKNLYFYNWDFQYVDTVQIEYSGTFMVSDAIMGETAERILLTQSHHYPVPTHYINKSELGSEQIQVHEFDLTAIEEMLASVKQFYPDAPF